METVVWLSNWWVKVVPLLTVFKRPPDAVAMKYRVGSAS